MKIGILTGGGDCPGLNAVIRAVTKKAILSRNMDVIGIEDGFEGLINEKYRALDFKDVSGILTLGGTILGTTNKADPYNYVATKGADPVDVSADVIRNIRDLDLDCLVCIGGDGTLAIACKMMQSGIPVVGVPKTIDNDIIGTEITFGFQSAVNVVTDGIDRIHTTAQSHHRVMIIEAMGRTAGWIALYSGIAGGGDIILIPEIPYNLDVIAQRVKDRNQKDSGFSIIVVAEGAKPQGGDVVIEKMADKASGPVRLGGIAQILSGQIEEITGLEARAVDIGHLQRGGAPCAFDRVLATKLGTYVVDMIQRNKFGFMVGVQGQQLIDVALSDVAKGARLIDPQHYLVQSARSLGTCFGD
ncbi:MAG: ATP-dependent 6-phosphofructokinase [Candidatus Omnitrophica bacterium]|nr:ATP-dependent 6-phosphofructokinase [Candidatus Omnitrophota bacterium]